jgi:hypothetical protein
MASKGSFLEEMRGVQIDLLADREGLRGLNYDMAQIS